MAALRQAAEATATMTPGDRGHLALVRAEHASMITSGESEAWSGAVVACREMNEPFVLSYALLRHAEALTTAGDAESAAASAREALALARQMGAAPLVEQIEALMRRARLRPADAVSDRVENGVATDGPVSDELERLGLTSRERESCASSPRDIRTARSAIGCSSAERPRAFTYRTSSPSSGSRRGSRPRRSRTDSGPTPSLPAGST